MIEEVLEHYVDQKLRYSSSPIMLMLFERHDRKQKMIRLSTCQIISGQEESCILDIFKLLLLQPCSIPFRQRNLPQSSCNKIMARLLGWVSC